MGLSHSLVTASLGAWHRIHVIVLKENGQTNDPFPKVFVLYFFENETKPFQIFKNVSKYLNRFVCVHKHKPKSKTKSTFLKRNHRMESSCWTKRFIYRKVLHGDQIVKRTFLFRLSNANKSQTLKRTAKKNTYFPFIQHIVPEPPSAGGVSFDLLPFIC